MLELHGWGDLGDELNTLSKQGEWVEMGELITDEMLDTFAVVAEPEDVAPTLARPLRRRSSTASASTRRTRSVRRLEPHDLGDEGVGPICFGVPGSGSSGTRDAKTIETGGYRWEAIQASSAGPLSKLEMSA